MKTNMKALSSEAKTLVMANEAAAAAALKIWKRDGKQDRGACGGAVLELDQRSKLYKTAEAMGFRVTNGSIHLELPREIASQNVEISEAQYLAFKSVIEAGGYSKAIKRFRTYVD